MIVFFGEGGEGGKGGIEVRGEFFCFWGFRREKKKKLPGKERRTKLSNALSISFKGPRFSPCPSASATLTSAVVPGVSSTIAAPGAKAQSAVDLPEFIFPTKTTLVRGKAEVSSLVNRWRSGPEEEGAEGQLEEEKDKVEEYRGREREEKLRRCCPFPEAFPFPTLPSSPLSPPLPLPPVPLLPPPPPVLGRAAGRSPSPSTTTASALAARVACGGSPHTPRATLRPTLAVFV